MRLAQAALAVIALPKTIDNDVAMTHATFGFDTALRIATEAIDRLRTTAHSYHRIGVAEIYGAPSRMAPELLLPRSCLTSPDLGSAEFLAVHGEASAHDGVW